MKNENIDKVRSIFVSVLGLKNTDIVELMHYGKSSKWDSMAHIMLVGELDEHMGIYLEPDDIIEMTTFNKIIDILDAKNIGL